MIINFGFGRPQRQQSWANRNMIVYGRPSQGILPVGPVMQPLVNNQVLTLPVNCVTISEQRPNREATGLSPGAFKAIFRE